MQAGRQESKAVRDYLEALEAHRPKRGRKRTTESVNKRLAAVEQEIEEADPLSRLNLVQERMDLIAELESLEAGDNLAELEAAFISAAAAYSERRGISYSAWREVGVDAAVLKQAGISRAGA